jgi:hypothetical protein
MVLPFLIVCIFSVSPDDASTKFTPVTNYPGVNGTTFDATSAVYVEKINRIYIFGGSTRTCGSWRYHDSIWYIDLPSPPAFDCSNLTQGSYPHPTDCASFFICLDGELAGEFRCSSTDLFDPVQQTCNIPELIVCFFTCEGRDRFSLTPVTVVSTSAAEKVIRQSKCSTVRSRFSSILFSSSVTFLSWSTALQSYPVCRKLDSPMDFSDSSSQHHKL